MPPPRLPLSLLKPHNPLHWPAILSTLRAGQQATAHAVNAGPPPDHLLAFWALPSGHWARRAVAGRNIPYSIWALGSDIWGLGKIPLIRGVLRGVIRESALAFADGHQLQAAVEKLAGRQCFFLPSSRQMPSADANMKLLRGAPPYRLGFLGRWHPNKGIDLLLAALGKMPDDDWKRIAAVRICGGGPLAPRVHAEATALRDQGRPVELGGYLDRQQAAELLNWADYLLIPSRIESIPVVFSDAMQCRCPVICMPVGDLPRLVHDYRVGHLAAAVAPDAFAAAVRTALGTSPAECAPGLAAAAAAFDPAASVASFRKHIQAARN